MHTSCLSTVASWFPLPQEGHILYMAVEEAEEDEVRRDALADTGAVGLLLGPG